MYFIFCDELGRSWGWLGIVGFFFLFVKFSIRRFGSVRGDKNV